MTIKPVPEGFHTITPKHGRQERERHCCILQKVFGAEEILRLTMPGGSIVHCELKIGDSRLNLGEAMEGWPEHALLAQLFVDDSDAMFKRAVDAGCKQVSVHRASQSCSDGAELGEYRLWEQ